MRPTFKILFGILLLLVVPHAHAQQEKLAQTGMKFLSVSVAPWAAALGDVVTAREGGSAMLFYNPAGMAWQASKLDLSLGQTQWIADIQYNAGSFSFRPANGKFGVFGFSFLAVDFGDLEETIRFDNDQGFLDVGLFSPSAWSAGVGYAIALSDRFSIGTQVKYANQDLGDSVIDFEDENSFTRSENSESVLAFDFGMHYKTGFRSLIFAVSARNFSSEITYEEESLQLPLTLKIGVSFDLMDLMPASSDMHQVFLAIDAENPRDFSEQLKVGAEYIFLNTISLRAGYVFPTDEQGINLGVGLQPKLQGIALGADYSYTDFGVFSAVHRLGLRLSF